MKGLFWLFMIFSFPVSAQINFQKVFGISTAAIVYSAEQTRDSGYVFAGYSGLNLEDFCLIKADINGDVSWTKSYNSGADEDARSIKQTTDGGYIMCGTAWFSNPFTHIYIYVVKTNALGDTLWTKFYYVGGGEFGYSISQTNDGGYIIAGEVMDTITSYDDAYIIRIDSIGDLLWSKGYGGTEDDVALDIMQTQDGFAFIGYTTNLGIPYPFFIRTDTSGNVIASRTYNISGYINSFSQTSDGGYILAGGANDAMLFKIDSIGNIVWSNSYGGSGMDIAYSVRQTFDNGYIFSGVTTSYGDVWGDFYLVRCDSTGNVLWSKTYGGINEDYSYAVRQAKDSGFIAAGITNGLGNYTNLYFIKTDINGNTNCNEDTAASVVFSVNTQMINMVMNSNIPGTNVSNTSTNIVVRGNSRNLCSSVNIDIINKPIYFSFYPNPIHASATIRFADSRINNVCIKIYNTMGLIVRSEKIPNITSYILYRGGLNDGLYFYEVLTPDYELIGTGKFVVE